MKQANDDFTIREWLAADGDARPARDPTLANGTQCDDIGCVARLPDKRLVALTFHPEGLEDDCRRAAIVVTARNAPTSCAAIRIDRNLSRESGALALRWNGASFDMIRARPHNYDRPWARSSSSGSSENAERLPLSRPLSRDATPRAEDLEAGD
jgi:competence protein ComEC